MQSATAIAHPNIAFIKYWGDIDPELRIPANGSISMNLDGLYTRTTVSFDPELPRDEFRLGGDLITGFRHERVTKFLEHVRQISGMQAYARVESENNFPSGTGIASSASAFAALSLAASSAAGLQLDERDLSRLARRGSGSACRSVPGGFVEWQPGNEDTNSFATSLASADHWNMTASRCSAMSTKRPVPMQGMLWRKPARYRHHALLIPLAGWSCAGWRS